jgi:hypothetical protein
MNGKTRNCWVAISTLAAKEKGPKKRLAFVTEINRVLEARNIMPKRQKLGSATEFLYGWQQIAAFLSQPISVAQRWAKSGMPVRHMGRRVQASPDELKRWLERESAGKMVQIASDSTNLSVELKRGLSFARKQTRNQTKNVA